MKVTELFESAGKRFKTVVVRGRFHRENEVSEDGLLGLSSVFISNAQKKRAQKLEVGQELHFKNSDPDGVSKVYVRRVA